MKNHITLLKLSRRCISKLLRILDQYNIPLTWGIVANLLDDDWKSPHKTPLLYAPDIAYQILESDVEHEIASHSLSHKDFYLCSNEEASIEIKKSKDILKKKLGITPKVFIFPKNHVRYIEMLKSEGFIAYRQPTPISHHLNLLRRVPPLYHGIYVIKRKTYEPLTISQPVYTSGLWGIPASILFEKSRWFSSRSLLIRVRRGLKRLVNYHGGILHLTLHDYSLADNDTFNAFINIIIDIDQLHKGQEIEVTTMYELTRRELGK